MNLFDSSYNATAAGWNASKVGQAFWVYKVDDKFAWSHERVPCDDSWLGEFIRLYPTDAPYRT